MKGGPSAGPLRPDWQRRGVALAGSRAWPRFNNIMRDFCLFWRSAFLPSVQRVCTAQSRKKKKKPGGVLHHAQARPACKAHGGNQGV